MVLPPLQLPETTASAAAPQYYKTPVNFQLSIWKCALLLGCRHES
jgi:hypothetical protein